MYQECRKELPCGVGVPPVAPVNPPKLEAAKVHLTYRARQVVGGSAPVDNLRA